MKSKHNRLGPHCEAGLVYSPFCAMGDIAEQRHDKL